MSAEATTWAMYRSKAKREARLVLLLMADDTGEDGICAAPLDYLATTSRLPREEVDAAVKELQDSGEIRCVMHGGRPAVRLPRMTELHAQTRAADGRPVWQLGSAAIGGSFCTGGQP